MKPAVAILMSNLLITSTSFAAISLSASGSLIQHIGLIALGLVLVVGLPLLVTCWPADEIAPSSATMASAAFGMVFLS